MNKHGRYASLIELMRDPYVKAMLLLSKETLSASEKQDIKESYSILDEKKYFELCKEHELEGVVASNLVKYKLPISNFWLEEYNDRKNHLSEMKDIAIKVCAMMKSKGIQMIVLKNGGIMIDMIEDVAKCPMEDIDSLVQKEDFLQAHEILKEYGFNFKFRNEFEKEDIDSAFRDGSTEYWIDSKGGEPIWFELSWRVISGRWIRPDKEPTLSSMREEVYLAENTSVGILSAEDNLLQVCVHTAKHSYVRPPGLRLHLDVDRIVQHKEIDWDLFLEKVMLWNVRTSTYFSLLIPSILLGTEIPDYVLDKLRPGRLKEKTVLHLITKAGLLHPFERKFSKIQFLIFQTHLYDTVIDIFRVIYPGVEWMKERYSLNNSLMTLPYAMLRILDLVGIRFKS